MRDHEAGLRSAFKSIREEVVPALAEITEARKALHVAFAALKAKQAGGSSQ